MTTAEVFSKGELQNHVDTSQLDETKSFLPDLPSELEEKEPISDDQEPKTTDSYRDYSLCKRLSVDLPFRRRFIHTVWLYWAYIGLGWCFGQVGPSFPDLQTIIHQDLDAASWLVSIFFLGYMLGSLVGGILYDRFNKLLLIGLSVLILAVSTGITPWCTNLTFMMLARFITGLGGGGLDTGGNADLVSIWDEEGRPYMQALHFCFGFGGIMSPLATEPFLAIKDCVPYKSDNSSIHLNTSSMTTAMYITITTKSQNMSTNDNNKCEEVYGESEVKYAYLISCILVFSACLPFLIMYIRTLKSKTTHDMAAKKQTERPKKLPIILKLCLLVLLSCFMAIYNAVEDTFSVFLATFCINYLHWDKDVGSFATSVHWTAFTIGRFSGIFLIRFFKPDKLLCVYCIFLITSFSGLLLASLADMLALIWLFIALAGFSMSIIFGCIFSWTEESILKVTGKISSIFLISASSGLIINPILVGHLMDNYSPIWFVYLLLGESILCLVTFLSIVALVKKYVLPVRTKMLDLETVSNEQDFKTDCSVNF